LPTLQSTLTTCLSIAGTPEHIDIATIFIHFVAAYVALCYVTVAFIFAFLFYPTCIPSKLLINSQKE